MPSNALETVKSIKETSSYIAMSTGAGMTQTSISIIQIAGVVIGAGGLIVAVLRWAEAKRTNDFNREKWEYEKHEGNNVQKTKEEA